jgi:hypothetical protein
MAPFFDIRKRSITTRTYNSTADPSSRPDRFITNRPHTLEHLSIWAYIALAFVIFALTVVMVYACCSCCRSHVVRIEQVETRDMGKRQRGWLPLKGQLSRAESQVSKTTPVGLMVTIQVQKKLLDVSRFSSGSSHTSHSTSASAEVERPLSMKRTDESSMGSISVRVVRPAPARIRTQGECIYVV